MKITPEFAIMFWKYNTNSSSQIESLLAKEDVTLQEVMDSEDIINECRVQNKMLIDFLQKREVMQELVTLITKEPSIELEERTRFKYPNIACELLTCDVPALNERLASDEVLLDKLYNFLENDPPLNPLLASYFSKIMGALIAKKTEQNWLSYQFTCLQVLDFLKAKDDFIPLLLKHLGTSAIMDLTLKLMTQVEGVEMRQNILNWLDSQRIMQSLISLLNPRIDSDRHCNVAQLLCDFIRIARDTQRNSTERADPDPLLNTIESQEIISLLLEHILGEEKSETAIVGGIQVLLALLEVYPNSLLKFNTQNIYNSNINDEANDIEQRQGIINSTVDAIRTRVCDFLTVLVDPPRQSPMLTTLGMLDPPLGNTRLQVAKLFAAIISTNNEDMLTEIISCGMFKILIELFFKYPWNNFLHTQVEHCLISAMKTRFPEGSEAQYDALYNHLLVNCKLTEKILEAWKENDEQQAQEGGVRKGYMGHLISILNQIVELCSTTSLGQYLKDTLPEVAKSLDEFKETTLTEVNKIQDSLLGGAHPNSSVEENEGYDVIPFPQSSALQQQMFSQYQMQHLTSQYIDGYSGFNDDAFNDGDDTLQTIFRTTIDHRTDMNFDLSEGDLVQQQEIFKQVCAQNINTLDDADDMIFDEKDYTFPTVIEKRDRNDAVYSSDSDDEVPTGDDNMEVDAWPSPKPSEPTPATLVNTDPWGSNPPSTDNSGWADFSSANFEFDFSDKFATVNATTKDKESLVVYDLKVDNVEEKASKEKAQSQIELKTSSININAQNADAAQLDSSDNVKNASGDGGDKPTPKIKHIDVIAEPSKNIQDNVSAQSESADKKDKVEV